MAEIKSAFHVLGLDDAHELDLKADIVDRIGVLVRERALTQAAAGEAMGLGQAEVSKMLSGHLDRFTVDRLVKALAALGERVRVTFEPIGIQASVADQDALRLLSATAPVRKVSRAGSRSAAITEPASGTTAKAPRPSRTKKPIA